MGSDNQKLMSTEKPDIPSTEAPKIHSTNCPSIFLNKQFLYLALAFVAGVLLTLLVTLIICLIKKSCPKYPSSLSQEISQPLDPPHKSCSNAEEVFISGNTSCQGSEENGVYFSQHQSAELDCIVYAQIKVQTNANLATDGSGGTS
ncbi:transmembrane protein C1orf162 homolog [Monodelphis domestica]|uniref:transmembrane protein C1orf162 homolog n=1 Tax=Monodelphis domestica TaxID=13616 RepID=UPI0024E19CCA|nr:transmembrane protein C1orf162 homolog [Monodelphis domestica]XP_056675183.1 transmembrane protein C1orf162 homolog [Monodelphis domestica]